MMQINNKSNATLTIAILKGTNSPKGQIPSGSERWERTLCWGVCFREEHEK
jgi:hypothetical protein